VIRTPQDHPQSTKVGHSFREGPVTGEERGQLQLLVGDATRVAAAVTQQIGAGRRPVGPFRWYPRVLDGEVDEQGTCVLEARGEFDDAVHAHREYHGRSPWRTSGVHGRGEVAGGVGQDQLAPILVDAGGECARPDVGDLHTGTV